MPLEQPQTSDPSESTRKVADAIAMGLVSGRAVEDIAEELVRQGWKKSDAVEFVEKIDEARRHVQLRSRQQSGIRRWLLIHLIMGAIWIAIGLALMLSATPQRDYGPMGVAVIALGAIEAGWSLRQMRTQNGR